MLAQVIASVGLGILFTLGLAHGYYTLFTTKFDPRDASTKAKMMDTHMRLTQQSSLWNAIVGFHLSHSLGVMAFTAIELQILWSTGHLWMGSYVHQALGLMIILGYYVLAKRYWFTIPQRGIAIAGLLLLLATFLPF